MSIRAWFSSGKTASACSVSSARESSALYGEVMTSSSSDGKTDVANLYASGNSSWQCTETFAAGYHREAKTYGTSLLAGFTGRLRVILISRLLVCHAAQH